MMKMPDNTWKSVMDYFHLKLDHLYQKEEVDSFFWWLVENDLKKGRLDYMKEPDIRMSESQLLDFIRYSRRLAKFEPIQHLTGHTDFMGLNLVVSPAVLIPRPETEELVSWVIDSNKGKAGLNVLDICTGSGCIALALKNENSSWNLSGYDVDLNALEVAKTNSERLNLNVDFLQKDALKLEETSGDYDVIVSNPPYIKELEREFMQENVLQFEPGLALFVPNEDPLKFYTAIAEWARKALKPSGQLYFEINEAHGEETMQMLKNVGFTKIELRNDIFDKPRMIKAI